MSEPIPTSGESFGDFQGAGANAGLKSPTSPTSEEDGGGWDNFVSARTDANPQPAPASHLSGTTQNKWDLSLSLSIYLRLSLFSSTEGFLCFLLTNWQDVIESRKLKIASDKLITKNKATSVIVFNILNNAD